MTVNMSELNSSLALEKEAYVKKLKRNLDRWRELVLFLRSVLLWKKQVYPWILVAVTSGIFLGIAYFDLSMVTIVSLVLLVLTLTDFLAPIVWSTIIKEEWTASKQKELEDICKMLATVALSAKVYYASLLEVKATRPNLYYPVTLATFCLLAWIGNSVNNLFITYLIVLAAVMLPGMLHLGIIQQYSKAFFSKESDFVKNLKSKIQ